MGLNVEANAIAAVEASMEDLQVVAICGGNEGALARLRAHPAHGGRLRALGFVGDIERYFAAADIVVTKPGGLTVSEVLAAGRPLILTRPIPGQEEANARFLRDAGAALAAFSPAALRRHVEWTLADPALVLGMSSIALRLGQPAAATNIARIVLDHTPVEAAARGAA